MYLQLHPSQRSVSGYVEKMKFYQKENFDLKLKIFYLEERLGAAATGNAVKRLSDENVRLKVSFIF